MKIDDSVIDMFSNRIYLKKNEKSERLRIWVGNERPDLENRESSAIIKPSYYVNLSEKAKSIKSTDNSEATDCEQLNPDDKLKVLIIEKMIEALTGKKVKIKIFSPSFESSQMDPRSLERQTQQSAGWGLEYDYHELQYEKETTSFESEGVIKTADGKEINFTVQLDMSREFMIQNDIHIRMGDAKRIDPLIINYSGSAAELTDTRFNFDLDFDGKEERISFLRPGSAFLAIDLNNDGRVNNGRELFGPVSGNGFGDLALYDEDGNHWIDENDSIYNKLLLWSRDDNGNDSLLKLKEKDIGALYLGYINTSFDVMNSENESKGQIIRSGIYVSENDSVGTIQQIDLTV